MRLGGILNLLSNILGGTRTKGEQVILKQGTERLVLPVTPMDIKVDDGQNIKTMNVVNVGDVTVFGMPRLKTISFSSFFPNPDKRYPFVVGDNKAPKDIVQMLTTWRENRLPVRVIIPSLNINDLMAIVSLPTEKKDGTGDVYYQLSLQEYKNLTLNTGAEQTDEVTGLSGRDDTSVQPNTATMVNRASDVLDVAKKAYGDYKHYRRVVESNNLTSLAINHSDDLRKLVIK